MNYSLVVAISLVVVLVATIIVLTVRVVVQDYQIKKLQKLADLDSLTDIPNRRAFHKMFHSLVEMLPVSHEASRKPASLSVLTLFALDMRDFKKVNDNLGHPAGDELLRDVVKVLQGELRQGDIFGRIGGDEFLIALPNVRFEEAALIGERLAEAVEAIEGYDAAVGITIGGVTVMGHPKNASALVEAADEALYEAKNAGVSVVVNQFDLEV